MSNPFDALDKPDAPAAGNPFDAFDNADDTAAREKVESDPSFRAIVSQFARNRLDGISAEARKLPTLDSVSTLEERDRAKFVRGELDAATAAHEEASRAYRDIQSRDDRDNLGRATEAMDAASRRLAFARELDADVAGKVVRQATPQQLLAIDRTITEQIRRVDYYEALIEQGDGSEDVQRNLAREKSTLIKLEAAREHARQRVADPNRPVDPSAAADIVAGIGQGMGSTFPSLIGAAGERIGQDTGNVGLTEIGRILREYGQGNRRDTVPAPSFSDLSIGKEGFGRDVRRFLATSLGEGVGTSLPIIATYMVGGAPAAMGGSSLLGIGQMQLALTEAFAQEGLELPADKAAWYVYTYGTAIGILESLTEVWGLRNFTGEAKKRAAKSIAAAMAAGAAKGAVMEGLTEGLQEIVEIAGVSNATGKPIDWDEARRRLIDATAAGAVPGVAFGTVSATGQRKHAFDLALEKAKELGFDVQPQTPAALPGGAPEITPPQDEPPKAPAEAAQTLPEPQPATAAPQADATTEPQPSTLPPALEPMADAIDAILPDGIGVDRQMFDKPVGDLVAETVAAVTGEPMAVEAAPEALVPAAPLQPEVQAQAEQIAAQPAPEQFLRQYITEGGSLSRSALPDLARRMAVTEQQLAQVMDEAVKRGELRKTAGGMYRRAAPAPAQAAPSMFKLADSHRQANDALDEALNFGRQILPRGVQVGVRPERIYDTRTGLEIDGQFDPSAGRIVLSAYAMQPKGVLAHEGLHVLVKQGQMTLDEVVILANHARKTGAFTPEIEQAYRQAYAGRANMNLAIDEEAAAHLIAARVNGADFGKQINAIIDRIRQVLERIANALKGRGFKSVDDVVNALVTGEMAQREPVRQVGRPSLPDGIRTTPTVSPPPVSGFPAMSGEVMYAIRAYHGSPHDFDRFDMSKIGTGEGAQAYGHGLYFAENEGVARSYRDALGNYDDTVKWKGDQPPTPLQQQLIDRLSGNDATTGDMMTTQKLRNELVRARRYVSDVDDNGNMVPGKGPNARRYQELTDLLDELKRSEQFIEVTPPGRMYEVRINADPADFLDWDKPLSQQSEKVRQTVESLTGRKVGALPAADDIASLEQQAAQAKAEIQKGMNSAKSVTEYYSTPEFQQLSDRMYAATDQIKAIEEARRTQSGAELIRQLGGERALLGLGDNGASSAASQRLREAGIPGIRYLDQGSRVAGEGSRNYVVFDDSLIEIVAKDGVPVTKAERAEIIDGMTDAPTGDDVMFSLVDASTGQSMRRDLDALGYYSQALEAAKGLKQAKGTPEQMLAQMKAAGVKDAEIEATGLRGFLEGKKSVTRDDVVKHLEDNRVGLSESQYGQLREKIDKTSKYALPQVLRAAEQSGDTPGDLALTLANNGDAYRALTRRFPELREDENWADTVAESVFGGDSRPAATVKWNTYSLDPSNPTYRETVLHLPKNEGFQTFEAYRASLPPAEQRYPEANIRAEFEATRPLDNFQSGHFPEPNIVGHMMTSMVKHEGKPVYLIDQIQSDWGQKLRDGGVRDEAKIAELKAKVAEANARDEARQAPIVSAGLELVRSVYPNSRSGVLEDLSRLAADSTAPLEAREQASELRLQLHSARLANESNLLMAELRTAEAATTGNPLVNTTDQWVNTTLRRAIRQAAEADAEFIAIPSGDTVLSYNPGDEAGMRGFYGRTFSDAEIASYRREIADAKARGDDKAAADYQSALDEALKSAKEGIVPKNLRNLLRKIDKASPDPIRTDKLETPTQGMKGEGFTVFPLTDKVKQSVVSEGQPMFALNLGSLFRRDQPLSGLNTIIRDLAHDVVLPIRQGLITEAAKKAKKGAKQAGIDLTSYYDPQTGVLRVTRMSDLSAVLGAVGEALIRRFDSVSQSLKGPGRTINPLEKLLAQNALGLVGQSGRAALWGMLPVPSGQTLVPILRDTLATYLHAWHAYKIAQGNAMMDPSAAKAAERALLNAQRQVARYQNRNLDAAISAEQQRLAALPPLAIAPQDFTDYVDLRYNPSTKITPPQISTLADPAEQRAAFAQWFRGYMLDPASTRMQDPAFFDAFEDLIDREDPTLSAKLDDSQAAIAAHAKAQPVQIIQAMIKSPERVTQMQEWFRQMDRDGLLPTLGDWARTLYRGGWDKLHPFYTAVRTLLELHQLNTGKRLDLKTTENAYKLLRLAPHSHAIAGRDLEDGIKNRLTNKPEGPSLVAALKTALGTDRASALDMSQDGPYQKFTAYLIARRAIRLWERFDSGELERPPLGASKDTARATIQTLEAANPEFMAAAEEVYEFQRNLLKLQRDAHLITPELYDQLVKDADYVPFLRDMTDKPGTPKRVLSKGAQSIIKKFKGSDRDILDPIATIAQKVYETRQLIAVNDAKLMLLQLAESAGPGAGMIAERLDDQQSKAMRVDLKNALRSLANEIGVSNADATALVHLAQQLLGDDMMATVFTKGQMKAGAEPVTWVYEKGVPVPMRLADGDLGRLMYETLENLGREHTHLVVQMMILPTQLVRGTITSNPAFILRNMFVDGLMAWMYEKTATPWLTQVGGFANAIRQTPEITEYARNAGLMGGVSTTSLDKLRLDRDVNALIAQGYKPKLWESPGAWMSELARNPLRKLFEASEASETGTRARLYKIAFDRAKANGLNDVEATAEAAFFAHDYMDYSRSGSVVGPVSRVVAFMNAAMQGMDRYFRLLTAKGDYGSAWKAYMDFRMGKGPALTARENAELAQSAQAWFVSMVVMGSMSLVITALFGDDERLKEIPEELRSTHWIIPLDGILHLVPKEMPGLKEFLKPLENQMLRLPKAFETAWFANLIERVVLEAARGNPRWWENYMRDLKNTLNPPMEPQALQLIYELKTGKNMFSGRDIVPTWKQERLREAQWDEYTSEFAKWLGKQTDTSPYYIDHTLKGLGTSWARDMLSLNVPGLPWYRENRPEKSLDEVIIARRFLWKAGKGADSSQKVREIMGAEDPVRGVWDRLSTPYSKLDASAETYKEYLKRRDPASASELLDRLKPAERGYAIMDANLEGDASKYKMVHPMHRADRVLREISGLQKEILADLVESKKKRGKQGELIPLDPSEKRAALDALTQFQMMEAHNALVLTGETGWDKRAYFDSASVLAEMKAAVPAVAEEFERRMKKAHVLPFDQVRQVWPKLKETIEAPEFAALSKADEKREIRSRIRSLYGEAR